MPETTGVCGAARLPATDAGCEEVAARFRALSEPTRLKIVRRLARGDASAGEILAEVGGTQANVSRHLAVLLRNDFVARTKRGVRATYRIADPALLGICALVCDGVARGAREKATLFLSPAVRER